MSINQMDLGIARRMHAKFGRRRSARRDGEWARPYSPTAGRVIATPEVGGLHHRDERRVA